MSGITPRERVLMAIEHKEPDRIPIDFASFQSQISAMGPYGYFALAKHLGFFDEDVEYEYPFGQVVNPDPRIGKRFHNDFVTVGMTLPPPVEIKENYVQVFPFGWYWQHIGHYWYPDFKNAPLKNAKTVGDIEDYEHWPDPDDPAYDQSGVGETAKDLHENTDYAVIAEMGWLDFFCHEYHNLRTFQQWFIDMKQNPDIYHALMTKITDSAIALSKKFYKEVGKYIDMAHVNGDDLGWQYGPYFSNETYREFVKPYALKYNQAVRELTDAKFFYHCDGAINPLIEEFIDIGFDITSPVMYGCKDMEPQKLKKRYGDRITFHCGIDGQDVMSFGSVEEVKKHVTEVVRALAPGGGYIFALTDVKPETPPAQIVAAFDTAKEIGTYPIR